MFVYKELTRLQPTAAGGAATKNLPQFMQQQTQTNWCWAANGASVGNLYHGPNTYTQCGIANACLGKTTCCTTPGDCNVYGYLDKALEAAKSFDNMQLGAISFNIIQDRINTNEPIGTRVAWNNSGGAAHFTMLSGYDAGNDKITVQDPWYGTTTIVYDQYPVGYHSGGTWTHTYFTKKN
jgi:hypothetical protein